jgi:hypothetical protein
MKHAKNLKYILGLGISGLKDKRFMLKRGNKRKGVMVVMKESHFQYNCERCCFTKEYCKNDFEYLCLRIDNSGFSYFEHA